VREYADLHLCPLLDDVSNARSMANLLAELNTRTIGLVLPPERSGHIPIAHDVFKNAGLEVARRINLKPKSRNDLLRGLRRYRNQYEIVAVECSSFLVSRVAVRDRRVDIVYFPKTVRSNPFHARLANTCRAALEINMSELISSPNSGTSLFRLRRDMETAVEASTTVIGSTGASKPFDLRSPRDVASILNLIGLPLRDALNATSTVPVSIVRRNRSRLDEPQLEQGVRILRRSNKDA
jgi:RNase P/RNase MRP subunit p30